MVVEASRWDRGSLFDLRGRQMSHQQEKPKVGRNVEVEINQSVNEECRARHNPRKLQSPWKRKITLPEKRERLEKQNREEPGAAETAQGARFCKGLQVIIVGVVDDFGVIKSFVGWVRDSQSAEARAREWMVKKDVPGTLAHGGTLALSYFECLQRGKALQDPVNSQPGDDH